VQSAEELYMSLGIRSVSMDDIATSLGISKKTIYKYFKDKADLISQVAVKMLAEDESCFQSIEQESQDPIDEMHRFLDHARESITRMHPSIVFDIKKFYPKTWEAIEGFHDNSIKARFANNLVQGVTDGLYRQDIKADILSKLLYHEFEFTFDPRFFNLTEYKPIEVYNELLKHFFMGILTEKGKKLYDQYEK